MDYAILGMLAFLVILVGLVLDSVRNLGEDLDNRLSEIEDRIVHRNLQDETKADSKKPIRSMHGNHG